MCYHCYGWQRVRSRRTCSTAGALWAIGALSLTLSCGSRESTRSRDDEKSFASSWWLQVMRAAREWHQQRLSPEMLHELERGAGGV
eukprot:5943414-Amphidinium_carterae.5